VLIVQPFTVTVLADELEPPGMLVELETEPPPA
jgi:hypothetical protein